LSGLLLIAFSESFMEPAFSKSWGQIPSARREGLPTQYL